MIMANNKRSPMFINLTVEENKVTRRFHTGECPNCGCPVTWEQRITEWGDVIDGVYIPKQSQIEENPFICECQQCWHQSFDYSPMLAIQFRLMGSIERLMHKPTFNFKRTSDLTE